MLMQMKRLQGDFEKIAPARVDTNYFFFLPKGKDCNTLGVDSNICSLQPCCINIRLTASGTPPYPI